MEKILVVDDNDQNLYLLDVLLKSHGYDVLPARNGLEALETAQQDIPDLIISDILMPVMDGFTLCRHWKQDDRLKKIPFIFYTATYTDPKDEAYSLSLGADKYIRKPMDPDLFLDLIVSVVNDSQQSLNPVRESLIKDEKEGYKLYSTRLVKKLEKKMVDLEEEIKNRKIIETELRQAKKEWKNIFQAIGNPVFLIDPDYTILQANMAAVKATNTSAKDLIGKKCYEIFHDSAGPSPNCPMCQFLQKKQMELAEAEIEALGGSFLVSCTPILNEDNSLQKVIHMATDITALRKAEQSLQESEKKLRGIFENANIGIVLASQRGEIEEFNEEFRKILGYDSDELSGMNFSEFTHPEDLKKEHPYFKKFLDGSLNNYRMQKRYITKSHDINWVEITVSALRTGKGDIKQLIGMVLDIDEQKKSEAHQKQLENQLRQAQKMESIGNLAGGIAHDFNNILSAIMGYTELSLVDAEKGTIIEENLKEIYKAGKRATDLVKQILTFARKTDEQIRPLQPGKIAEEVLTLLRSTTPTTIDIRNKFKTTSYVMGNPTKLHQVFMNLCTNAIQSMEDNGGILKVDISEETVDPEAGNDLDLGPGTYVIIEVSDTGKGIPQENIVSIFDPYFTTKSFGRGTGLGLSTVHGIVKTYGGDIIVKSDVNKGSVFRVYLPVVTQQDEKRSDMDHAAPKGKERILFVDDEFSIADVGGRILTKLGYAVITQTDSLAALEIFQSTPHDFDLVITDMTMPHMTGDKLALELFKIRSDIPVILLTGYNKKLSEEQAFDLGIKAFAYKPLTLDKLAKTVRRVLDDHNEHLK